MHDSAMEFACSALTAGDVAGKYVLEAGSLDVNGSVRPHVESLGPAWYTGTDMRPGPRVDLVMDAGDLPGDGSADVVISTEMLQHAADWQAAMRGMISVLAPGGVLVLTTRFSAEVMGRIVEAAGLDAERLEADPLAGHPGVFVKARKPPGWEWPDDVAGAWEQAGVTVVTT